MISAKDEKLPRLAFIGANPSYTWGLSIVTRELMKRLNGFDKYILSLQREPAESMETPSYKVYTAHSAEGIIYWLKQIQPDIIVAYQPVNWLPGLNVAMQKMKYTPSVPFILYVTVETEPLLPIFTDVMLELQADLVITPSKWSSSVFEKEGFKTDYLYHGVDQRIYHPMPHFKQQREQYVFGCVARNDRRKGIERLIKSFSLLPKREECMLNLVCSAKEQTLGRDLNVIARMYNTVPEVNFYELNILGVPLDTVFMGGVYNYFDVHVLPTSGEAFGLPVLESLACGIPTIVTDIPVMHEIYGDAVLYTPMDGYSISERGEMPLVDVEALTARMEMLRFGKKLHQDLSEKGVELSKKYTWESATFKLASILHHYLEK